MKFLLLQTRNADDPMRHQEVASFARVLGTTEDHIQVLDLLTHSLAAGHLDGVDMAVLGGSG
jgi:hypothetical protein